MPKGFLYEDAIDNLIGLDIFVKLLDKGEVDIMVIRLSEWNDTFEEVSEDALSELEDILKCTATIQNGWIVISE